MNAIALLQNFDKPDIFIIMTCNSSWSEIKDHLLLTDEAQNRPNLVSRMLRAKIKELKTNILKRNILKRLQLSCIR